MVICWNFKYTLGWPRFRRNALFSFKSFINSNAQANESLSLKEQLFVGILQNSCKIHKKLSVLDFREKEYLSQKSWRSSIHFGLFFHNPIRSRYNNSEEYSKPCRTQSSSSWIWYFRNIIIYRETDHDTNWYQLFN